MKESAKNEKGSNELSLRASELCYRRLFETVQDEILIRYRIIPRQWHCKYGPLKSS